MYINLWLQLSHRLPRGGGRKHGHKGAILNGISGQGISTCIDCGTEFVFTAGGTTIFPRQTVHQRAQAL